MNIFGYIAFAGLKVLFGVDRKGRRMLASETGGSKWCSRFKTDRTPGSDLIRASVPARTHPQPIKCKVRRSYQGAAAPKRNDVFDFHIACRMTASLWATATFAFLNPAVFAIRSPQAFSEEKAIPRVRMTFTAS